MNGKTKAKSSSTSKGKETKGRRGIVAICVGLSATLAGIAAAVGNYQKVCSFIDDRTGWKTCGVSSEIGTDIVFAPFYNGTKFEPGNGHSLMSAPPIRDGMPVFQGGAVLTTALSRPESSPPGVSVTALEVKLLEYKPDPVAELDYDYGLSNVTGKAIAEKLSYRLALDGKSVKAYQFLDADQKAAERSPSDLLSDKQITFKSGEPPQALRAIVDVASNGLYKIVFLARYTAGTSSKTAESQPVLVYRHE